MKKTILLLTLLISFLESNAQQLSLGPKAGLNSSNLSNAKNSESLMGINAGGFVVYSIVEHFGVSMDLLYSAEGAKYSTSFNEASKLIESEYKLRLNYLRVPLLANIFFGQLGDKVRPKISLGPSFGFLMGVKKTTTTTTTEGSSVIVDKQTSTDKSGLSGMDLSAIVGAGLNFKLGELTWLNLDARYSMGTTDINEVKQDDAVKNNVFSVDLGLAFGLK